MGIAAATAGAAVLGAGASIISGNKAAKAQKDAAAQSSANERYFYDTTRQDQAPYREVGTSALHKLAGMYGVGDGPGGGSVDWSGYAKGNPDAWAQWQNDPAERQKWNNDLNAFGQFHYQNDGSRRDLTPYTSGQGGSGVAQYGGFTASPGYQFRLDEGVKAAEHSAAARGLLGSGATMKGIQRYGEGLASSEYENYANALRSMAGVGQTSTQATSAAGQSAANGISNAFTNAGNARASSYANTGASINNGASNVLSSYLRYGGGGGGISVPGYGLPGGASLPMPGSPSLPGWGINN